MSRPKEFGTKVLPLYGKGHLCVGGPLRGAYIFITEHSRNTAYIEVDGDFGKYSLLGERLVWHSVKEADLRLLG